MPTSDPGRRSRAWPTAILTNTCQAATVARRSRDRGGRLAPPPAVRCGVVLLQAAEEVLLAVAAAVQLDNVNLNSSAPTRAAVPAHSWQPIDDERPEGERLPAVGRNGTNQHSKRAFDNIKPTSGGTGEEYLLRRLKKHDSQHRTPSRPAVCLPGRRGGLFSHQMPQAGRSRCRRSLGHTRAARERANRRGSCRCSLLLHCKRSHPPFPDASSPCETRTAPPGRRGSQPQPLKGLRPSRYCIARR